jgi:hypothetical protein
MYAAVKNHKFHVLVILQIYSSRPIVLGIRGYPIVIGDSNGVSVVTKLIIRYKSTNKLGNCGCYHERLFWATSNKNFPITTRNFIRKS